MSAGPVLTGLSISVLVGQTTLYDNRVNYDDRRIDCKKQYFACKMMLATMAAKGIVLQAS